MRNIIIKFGLLGNLSSIPRKMNVVLIHGRATGRACVGCPGWHCRTERASDFMQRIDSFVFAEFTGNWGWGVSKIWNVRSTLIEN